jgi:AraC family L-rhamnose operon regulatory protein RhaS
VVEIERPAQNPQFIGDDIWSADTCEALSRAVAQGDVQMAALARGHYPGRPLPDDMLPGLRTAGFWDAAGPQGWGLDWHRNEGIEVTYLERGSLDFAMDGTPWPVAAGQITVTRPWQEHRVGGPTVAASRLHWCILDVGVRRPNHTWRWPDWVMLAPGDLSRLTELLQHNEQPVWPANRALDATFAELAALVTQPDRPCLDSLMRVALNRLLVELLCLLETQAPVLDGSLSSARRGVEMFLCDLDRMLDRKWMLSDMADACGLGRTQFTRYCQDITNMTPIEYLNFLRLRRAAARLREVPDLSITDIAFECGFESSQYFSTSFSRAYRMSPRAWRAAA